MGNSLGIELGGKCVLLKKSVMSATYQGEAARTVNVTGGNGSREMAWGHSLYVQFVVDGTTGTFYGEDVERLIGDAQPIVIHTIELGDRIDWHEHSAKKSVLHLGAKVVKIGRKYVYATTCDKVHKVALTAVEDVVRSAKYA